MSGFALPLFEHERVQAINANKAAGSPVGFQYVSGSAGNYVAVVFVSTAGGAAGSVIAPAFPSKNDTYHAA